MIEAGRAPRPRRRARAGGARGRLHAVGRRGRARRRRSRSASPSCRPRPSPSGSTCSTAGHAPDLLGRLRGTGERRLLLVGHLDTVVAHEAHRPLTRDGDRLLGSGTVDMKGGVALALGVMRELAGRPELYAEAAVLLVNDEEWRTVPFAHTERFSGWDACLCFEAGEVDAEGDDAVIVQAQGRRHARGQGARPAGALGLGAAQGPQRAARARRRGAADRGRQRSRPAPSGSPPCRRSCTRARPSTWSRRRAGSSATCAPTTWPPSSRCSRPCREQLDGVSIESALVRAWPGMDTRAATAGAAGGRRGAAGAPAGGLRARRRQRRQPHRAGRPGHGRRPRPARRGRPHARRVGRRRDRCARAPRWRWRWLRRSSRGDR